MILDWKASNSDTKIKDSSHDIKNSTSKILYLLIMCFLTNCLSSITLETGWRGSLRSISTTRSATFNNLFRRNYNLSIKTMMTDVLTALVSTIMLIIGDIYGIPYLYLPWLINTIEGMILHEMPTLFELAYTVLPNISIPKGIFIFLTLIVYVEELCICRDILMNFKRCWTNYNKNKLHAKSESTSKESCNENKTNFDILAEKLEDQRQVTAYPNESNNHDTIKPAMKPIKSNLSFKNIYKHVSFTEVSG